MPPVQLCRGPRLQAGVAEAGRPGLRGWPELLAMNQVRMQLRAGEHALDAYVARTEDQRALGLMHRAEMAPDEGMLFICDERAVQSFWMKDTPVPLSIAFLEDDGTIVHIEDMAPQSLDSHACEHSVRHVLGVPMGWFRERGIGPGTRVQGPVFQPVTSTSSN
ncbi:MAG: hypothetical protein NVS2B4_21350 [Ramlibacter sp.]